MVRPDFLCHYYEAEKGPFLNLSDFAPAEAEQVLDQIRQRGDIFASKRSPDYLTIRRELETKVRQLFIAKGGRPVRERPHYMILGACSWLIDWYKNGRELWVPLTAFHPEIVSFTYGDTFPAMRYQDGKPYRRQVYTYHLNILGECRSDWQSDLLLPLLFEKIPGLSLSETSRAGARILRAPTKHCTQTRRSAGGRKTTRPLGPLTIPWAAIPVMGKNAGL